MEKFDPCLHLDHPEAAHQYHQQALSFLSQHDVAPNPLCHALAYVHASGRHEPMSQDIAKQAMLDTGITGHYLRDLFLHHFPDTRGEQLEDHLEDLHRLLYQALEGVSQACKGTVDYSASLDSHIEQLKGNPGIEGLQRIAGNLLQATQKAHQQNLALQQQLEQSQSNTLQLKGQIEQLQQEVSLDALTGLLNRRSLDRRLDALIEDESLETSPLTLLMMDIDHFKNINDTYGHPIGDKVIQRIGSLISQPLSEPQFAARYGGEEFTVVLPETKQDAALRLAEEIHQSVSKMVLVRRQSREKLPPITISIGCAHWRPGEDRSLLVERADQALYQAKHSGRNCIVGEHQLLGA